MTFRLPLCNVKQITEWVQQELICPGDWLGDWAIVHVLSEAGRSLKWASEWRRRRADVMKMNGGSPAPRRASCWADRWWTAATCNTNHSDDNTTSAQKKLFYTSHFTFNIFTSLLWIKNMLHDVFQIQSLFVFMPLQRFWGNFFTFSSSSSVTSWRPVLVNTLSISNFGTKVNMDWRMNWLDCGGQRFIIKRSKVCDPVIIQRHSSETPAWCVHGGVQPWCSNYNKLVKMCRFDRESEPKPQSNSQINSE